MPSPPPSPPVSFSEVQVEECTSAAPLEIDVSDPNAAARTTSTRSRESASLSPAHPKKTVAELQQENTLLRLVPKYIVDPRSSKFVPWWDGITSLALIFTALVTPYEVAFIPPARTGFEPLFLINRVIDLIFLSDIFLSCRLMYPEGANSLAGAKWVADPRKIARNYLTGWFALDFLSVSVLVFDIMPLQYFQPADASDGDGGIEKLKVLRVLRALRLIKLVRLVRASRIMKRWEVRIAINYALISLVKCLVSICVYSHWFACIWALQTTFAESRMQTWLGRPEYCWYTTTAQSGADAPYACKPGGTLYVASLYWAVMTITSIGYGDIAATHGNELEQGVATALMLLGSMCWGQVIATLVSLLSTMDPETTQFRQIIDELNRFMALQTLPVEMQRRIREYFHQTKHLREAPKHKDLIAQMSPSLQSEVAWTVNEQWLKRIWFLEGSPKPFLVKLALHLKPIVFAPMELCPIGHLYIVHRGLALYGGRVLGKGKVWGEDAILKKPSLRRMYCARAMNFLEVMAIDRETLAEVASHFPDVAKRIKSAGVKLAFIRTVVQFADQERAKSDGQHHSSWQMMLRAATEVDDDEMRAQRAELGELPSPVDGVASRPPPVTRPNSKSFERAQQRVVDKLPSDRLSSAGRRNSEQLALAAAATSCKRTASMSASWPAAADGSGRRILDLLTAQGEQQQQNAAALAALAEAVAGLKADVAALSAPAAPAVTPPATSPAPTVTPPATPPAVPVVQAAAASEGRKGSLAGRWPPAS